MERIASIEIHKDGRVYCGCAPLLQPWSGGCRSRSGAPGTVLAALGSWF